MISCIWPQQRKRYNASWAYLDFRDNIFIPLLNLLLWPIYQVTLKAASFEWDPEQEEELQEAGCLATWVK